MPSRPAQAPRPRLVGVSPRLPLGTAIGASLCPESAAAITVASAACSKGFDEGLSAPVLTHHTEPCTLPRHPRASGTRPPGVELRAPHTLCPTPAHAAGAATHDALEEVDHGVLVLGPAVLRLLGQRAVVRGPHRVVCVLEDRAQVLRPATSPPCPVLGRRLATPGPSSKQHRAGCCSSHRLGQDL